MLRAMTVRDLDAVVAVEARAYSHPWSRGNFTDSLAAGYLAEVLVDGAGEIVGYLVAMHGVDELHLLNITVVPAAQGQGHGQALMAALHRHARRQGLATLWLEVRQSNQRARALYRRLGYTEVGLRRGYYPAAVRREDAVVMSLSVRDAPVPPSPHVLD
ncbi:MAG: ribosomal-protein-alanine N-acetyltransferase [Leptothrix sp. (in: Bacteria)]|nr:ribosomal-protein-alanine N-acetyltransferase [Leptothrix sp. (in: b-proteobacteria)]